MRGRDLGGLAGWLALTLAVGFLAGRVTTPEIPGWYAHLEKPSFNPPNWIFAPVWTTLYVFMAVAAWRVWRKIGLANAKIGLYGLQLAVNAAWSCLFFGAHAVGLALADLVVLLFLILVMLWQFWRVDRLAGLLVAPYGAWVAFAGILNLFVWRLNP